MASGNQLIACVIKQYGTGLYRTCVKLDKHHAVCLSTHSDEAGATEMINRFLETYQQGQIKTLEDILIFIDSLSGLSKAEAEAAARAERVLFPTPSPITTQKLQ